MTYGSLCGKGDDPAAAAQVGTGFHTSHCWADSEVLTDLTGSFHSRCESFVTGTDPKKAAATSKTSCVRGWGCHRGDGAVPCAVFSRPLCPLCATSRSPGAENGFWEKESLSASQTMEVLNTQTGIRVTGGD